jgi:hypothetical protein
MFDDDLADFYDEADFALACTRQRPGVDDAQFSGILAVIDADQFDGHAVLGQHRLQYPTAAADLATGDVLRTQRQDSAGELLPEEGWRVLRSPERVVDGRESVVYLTADPEA